MEDCGKRIQELSRHSDWLSTLLTKNTLTNLWSGITRCSLQSVDHQTALPPTNFQRRGEREVGIGGAESDPVIISHWCWHRCPAALLQSSSPLPVHSMLPCCSPPDHCQYTAFGLAHRTILQGCHTNRSLAWHLENPTRMCIRMADI